MKDPYAYFEAIREQGPIYQPPGKDYFIVNAASLAGLRGISPGQAAYVGSKHGVVGLTKQMSLELGGHGIRVLGIAPGIGNTPLGRVGVSSDVARAIMFCASDMAMFMTGNTLLIDGGTAA